LQLVQGHQQRFERPIGQGLRGFVLLVLLKSIEPVGLVDPLGLVAEQHRIAVKSNAHFLRMRHAGVGRLRIHLRCGYTGYESGTHIA
jgi:hypothetical protein